MIFVVTAGKQKLGYLVNHDMTITIFMQNIKLFIFL